MQRAENFNRSRARISVNGFRPSCSLFFSHSPDSSLGIRGPASATHLTQALFGRTRYHPITIFDSITLPGLVPGPSRFRACTSGWRKPGCRRPWPDSRGPCGTGRNQNAECLARFWEMTHVSRGRFVRRKTFLVRISVVNDDHSGGVLIGSPK